MVENDMHSAPERRAWYSMAAATSISCTPGRILLRATWKSDAPSSMAERIIRISSLSLTMRDRSIRGGQETSRHFALRIAESRSRAASVMEDGSKPRRGERADFLALE